ncbi:uncharacterized protein LOC131158525 [Malania oleifera]|uniref:uncharacterized protein LOC131158525 n=1 Tax=Malania oleifera TaxID=397392 RepID=UPI0025ADC049|nr:uncharacterized protein LOC131158525 [Malania oleifera]
MDRVQSGLGEEFNVANDGALWFRSRLSVLTDVDIRKTILEEAHRSLYKVHPGSKKMYKGLRESYWWSGIPFTFPRFLEEIRFSYEDTVVYQETESVVQLYSERQQKQWGDSLNEESKVELPAKVCLYTRSNSREELKIIWKNWTRNAVWNSHSYMAISVSCYT